VSSGLKAQRIGSSSRRPRTFDKGRVCTNARCDTVISRYNQSESCYRHSPVSFPRLRGVITEA